MHTSWPFALNGRGVHPAKQLCLLPCHCCYGESGSRLEPRLTSAAAALWERGGRSRMDKVEGHDGVKEKVVLGDEQCGNSLCW